MNKIGKIVSLALAAAVCAGSVSIPVSAAEVEATGIVSAASTGSFSVEKYPYSYVKTFDSSDQIVKSVSWNESGKHRNLLSTRTSNPGRDNGPGHIGDAMILTFYSAHADNSYGPMEAEAISNYGNVVDVTFTELPETVYANETTGGVVKLSLSDATTGANKIGLWTKAKKKDSYERQEPEYVSYNINFSGTSASGITVKIPNDGEWHYVVADLATPIGDGLTGIRVSSSCSATFGSENNGRPKLKLDGTTGIYPLDSQSRQIKDIESAYVLNEDGEYQLIKTENVEYEYDPTGEGAFVNTASEGETPTYCRTDNSIYLKVVNENGEVVYTVDENGDLIYNIKTGSYVHVDDPAAVLAERYTVSKVESYIMDPENENQKLLDEEGNPIPAEICGNLVGEIWQTEIYIDDMVFYRTTESGGRTTFIPSNGDDIPYYNNTELDSVLIDGVKVYDAEDDGERRVLSIPKDTDLSNPDLSRFTVTPKCPHIILTANKDGGSFIPVDSSAGYMKSGSVGSITLPSSIDGKAVVTIISASGAIKDYEFDVEWGYDLSITAVGSRNTYSGSRKTFTIKNYDEENDRTVQVVGAVKNKVTNELISIAAGNVTTIPAGQEASVSVNSTALPGAGYPDPENCSIYLYFYDSIATMNQVVTTYVMDYPSTAN